MARRCVSSRNLENEEAKARYRAVKIQPQWVATPRKQQQHIKLSEVWTNSTYLPAVCVSVTVPCGIQWCFIGNWILTFQRHIFPSSSRVMPGLTDPWRRKLCVLLKHNNHITPRYKLYPKRTESSATLLQKSGNPQFQASLIPACITFILLMVHHFLLTIHHGLY